MIYRFAILSLWIVVSPFVCLEASAQSNLSSDALELADQLNDNAYFTSEEDWREYEEQIEYLPVAMRLQQYQDLAFTYLADAKASDYSRLRAKYSDAFEKFGNANHRKTQDVLDAFAERAESGDYFAAASKLSALVDTDALSDSQKLRALIGLAYSQADSGAQADAIKTLKQARKVASGQELAAINSLELEMLAAYVLMNDRDFVGAIGAMRASLAKQNAAGIPFDGTRMLSNTAWILREEGEAEAARTIQETVNQSRSKPKGTDRSPQMSGTSSQIRQGSGATGAGPARQLKPREYINQPNSETDTWAFSLLSPTVIFSAALAALALILAVILAKVARSPKVIEKPNKPIQRDQSEVMEDGIDFAAKEVEPEIEPERVIPEIPIEEFKVEDPIPGMLSGLKVLIVDDTPVNIEVLTEFLEIFGLETYYIAENGEEAVSIATRTPLDLILMDIQMPKMNGIEATKEIRATDVGKKIPIVAATAFSRIVNKDMCKEAGMNGFLRKPIELDDLEMQVRKTLNEFSQPNAA